MTSPDWDDERLEAAFLARSDAEPRPLPDDLVDETIARIQQIEPRRAWFARRGLVATATALGVLVAVAAFGVATLGPSIRPAGSSSPSATASVPVRSAAAAGVSVTALPRLDIDAAVAIRDAGVDDREIRVQGFFPGIPVMFCPMIQQPVNPTRIDCAPARITQNNVPLSYDTSGARNAGATIVASFAITGPPPIPPWEHPFAGGRTPAPTQPVVRLVVVGHFDDRRADLCLPEQVARCRDTFMVDRIDAVDAQSFDTLTYDAVRDASGGTSTVLTADEVDRLLWPIDPAFTILSRRVQTANLLPAIEPAWPTASLPLARNQHADERIVWSVTAMPTVDVGGRTIVRTFVVDDQTGARQEIDRDGVAAIWTPPEPTAPVH